MENVILGLAIGFIIGQSMERWAEKARNKEAAKMYWEKIILLEKAKQSPATFTRKSFTEN